MRAAVILLVILATPVRAGLHYSGEAIAELPAQWRGYLPDQRLLRTLPAPAGPNQPANPLREAYRAAAEKFAALTRPLTPDESADLGALRLRLGQVDAAVDGFRIAPRSHPQHFAFRANSRSAL